eukprot:8187611-Alexandrium_andersonii.AAC.2
MKAARSRFEVHDKLLVTYASDPCLRHVRYLVKKLGTRHATRGLFAGSEVEVWRVITPDREIRDEVLGGPQVLDIRIWNDTQIGRDFALKEVYAARHSALGRWKPGELEGLYARALTQDAPEASGDRHVR